MEPKKTTNGRRAPQPRLSVVVTEKFRHRVKVEALRRKQTVSEFVETVIREAIKA
jgi:predicted HicB family RNase H-like nuclease